MFENIAAIDIGTSSIKVIKIKTGFRDFQLKSFTYEDIDLNITDRNEAVRDALGKIIEEESLEDYKVVTNLPMEKIIIRNISFPFNEVEKIAKAIPFEAEENIPFNLDEMIMDFQSLKSDNIEQGRVLLAATHKDNMHQFISLLNDFDIQPIFMGMESASLFECYKYFNKIGDETIIQLDIGDNNTIINLVKNSHLLYTRSISVGVNLIIAKISEIEKIDLTEAQRLFHNLNIDLTSFENNIQRGFYKSLGISKPKFKKIFNLITAIIKELFEQILLTIKASDIEITNNDFNRILIGGGGSNIMGLGTLLSKTMEIPVVQMPFLEDYKEPKIQSQFPIAFGTLLCYVESKRNSINFLKGEFLPDITRSSNKIYYLTGGFLILTILVFIINIILSSIIVSSSNDKYDEIIQKRYKKYFHERKPSKNPILDAKKKLNEVKKDFEGMNLIISENISTMEILNDIILSFEKDEDFELNNFVINKRIVRIDGKAKSSKKLDMMKEKLLGTKKYNSISLSIKHSRFIMKIILEKDTKKNKVPRGKK